MIDFTCWKYYKNPMGENIGIQSPDSFQSRLLIDPDVAKWLADGGTPLPAESN